MSKVVLVVVGAVGYILGARAGRERYEQIRETAQGLWRDPRVQKKRAEVDHAIKENAPAAKEKMAAAAGTVADKAGLRHQQEDGDEAAGPTGQSPHPPADPGSRPSFG